MAVAAVTVAAMTVAAMAVAAIAAATIAVVVVVVAAEAVVVLVFSRTLTHTHPHTGRPFGSVLRELLTSSRGVLSLTRGFVPTVMQCAPMNTVFFGSYDVLHNVVFEHYEGVRRCAHAADMRSFYPSARAEGCSV